MSAIAASSDGARPLVLCVTSLPALGHNPVFSSSITVMVKGVGLGDRDRLYSYH